MNFPMDQAVFQFFYWLVNTPGLGSVAAGLAAVGSVLAYGLVLRWIVLGGRAPEAETYSYPTPAWHAHPAGAEAAEPEPGSGARLVPNRRAGR